jgi:hypothetical protein
MHVEGKRRRRAALAQRLIGDRVVQKACTSAAPFRADRQREEAFLAQAVVVLGRMAGVAVMRCRAGREIGGQLAALLLQASLLGAELKIHARFLLGRE